jgi:hypothetical protein
MSTNFTKEDIGKPGYFYMMRWFKKKKSTSEFATKVFIIGPMDVTARIEVYVDKKGHIGAYVNGVVVP